ncbi:uncharacterized protein EDB93DRAFT_1101579 [Suillus bovinus]|uniref:uncharacterized protein n=1 Tax=Suillus bovinus TaxID=48563 RepID=UPI001B8711F2|nr:uncharacterized protein EDB93DRAFT_1101579 [Suillus bovinus]KAG2155787.1 hypothetical protein EDB93DRAFT_1101579 [Suillus bovinus]
MALPKPLEESPLTSLVSSRRAPENNDSSALKPVHSYSDVVRVSSPVKDPKVEQESTLALNTATNINVRDQGDTALEKMAENITFRTANENSGITSESDDGDDRPWITVG